MKIWLKMSIAILIGVLLGIFLPQKVFIIDQIIKTLSTLSLNILLYLTIIYTLIKTFLGILHIKRSKKNSLKITLIFLLCVIISLLFSIIVSMGFMNLNIFKPDQISQYEAKPLKIYSFSEIILNILNSNILSSFEGITQFLLPVIFIGIIFGTASASLNKKSLVFTETVESFNLVLSKLSHQAIEIFPFFSIFIIAYIFRQDMFTEEKLQFISKPLIGVLLISFILIIFYTIFLYIIFKDKMPKFYLGLLGAALTALISGNTASAIIPLNEHLKRNIGVKKELSNFLTPIGMIINKSGTIIVSVVSLFSIILFFTPTILDLKLQAVIFLLLLINSFLLDGINEAGFLAIVAIIMNIQSLHLEDNSYLLFLPFVPILSRIGVFLDVITTGIFITMTAKVTDSVEIKEYIDFI